MLRTREAEGRREGCNGFIIGVVGGIRVGDGTKRAWRKWGAKKKEDSTTKARRQDEAFSGQLSAVRKKATSDE